MDASTFLPISTVSAMLDAGKADAETLVRHCLDRVATSALNCFIALCRDTALEEAHHAATRARSGRRLGRLDGIPVAVKDNIDLAGVPTTNGFGGGGLHVPSQDATVMRHLRAAGAVILGKLAMHEGALGATNDNPHHGRTHNPYRHGHSPGGSSGGSGAAVAAGLCFAALGTDTGGSVRIPAAYCGITGLKPSIGLVSTRGVVPLSYRLDHVGPLTRSVRDAALLLDVLAGYDPDCPESRRVSWSPIGPLEPARLKGLRIGVLTNFEVEQTEATVLVAFRAALDLLRDHGARISPLTLPGLDPVRLRRACFVRVEAEAAAVHGELYAREPQRFSAAMRGYLDYGLRLPATKLLQADQVMSAAAAALYACWDSVDVILSPATPQPAPSFDASVPENAGTFCVLANVSGCPAISLPMGWTTDGLPLGLQIIAPLDQDHRLLRIAAAAEEALRIDVRLPLKGPR
jgi:Asp-tRNA(Asn)/Glu-tRNA(Gln) amidotransferase A subunit family amidase